MAASVSSPAEHFNDCSPYAAAAVWPGERENPFRQSPPGQVGLIDCKLPSVVYEKAWTETRAAVKGLLASPPQDDSQILRDVAFCLPTDVAASITFRSPADPDEKEAS